MGVDYYGVLSIQKNSTELEIRKAYRNLALEFNPERLQDENAKQIFTLVSEAYDVLSDPLRRAVFDQYGEEGLKRGVPGPKDYVQPYHYHGDPMRTYKDFFGTSSPYADLLDHLRDPPPLYELPEGRGIRRKQPPIYHPLCLTLHEVFFGGVKKMKIHRLQFVGEEHTTTEVREKILSIPFKPGIRPNTEIIFPSEGDQNPTQIPADIIFVTEDRPHECFKREGSSDLVMCVGITLQDALLGTTVTVNTIDHRTVRVPITDIVSPGYEKVVEKEGMPVLEKPGEKGNLIIRFQLQFPQYLPKASKELFHKAFFLAKIGGGMHHEMINKMVLADKILRVDPDERLPPM